MHDDETQAGLDAMSLGQAVFGRASVRRFRPDPVPESDIRAMVAAAVRAANAGNSQPWRFIAVAGAALREGMREDVDAAIDEMAAWPELAGEERRLQAVRGYSRFFAGAPVVIAVCFLPYSSTADELLALRGLSQAERDRLRARPELQSVGAAVQLLCTAAHALGHGACWMTAPVLAAPRIERRLGVEPPARLAALVPVGRPFRPAKPSPRRPLDDVLEFR